MAKVSRLERRACGRDPPGGGKKFGLLPVACGLRLRTVVRACGRDPPYFLFLLEGFAGRELAPATSGPFV